MKMFNTLSQILIYSILGLCAWLWHQSNTISSLKAENLTQAQTIKQNEQFIEQLNKSIEQMNNQLEQERQATEQQKQIEIELRNKLKAEQLNVKEILVKEPCGSTNMPGSIIDSIKRLHQQSNNKH